MPTRGAAWCLLLASLFAPYLGLACSDGQEPNNGKSDAAAKPAHADAHRDAAIRVDADVTSGEAVAEVSECQRASDCPEPDHPGECATSRCTDGRCSVDHAARGTELAAQTAHDCRRAVCDGEGNPIRIDDDGDAEDDDNACTRDKCTAGSVLHAPESAGTICAQDGGKFCDGSGDCVECVDSSDCTSNVCQDGACRPPLCGNGKLDSGESDTDCGGSCGPCGPGRGCTQAEDCAGMECTENECAANCSDKVKNGAETDIDCGAACPTACKNGRWCTKAADCASGFCHPTQAKCMEPTCSDEFMNGDETAVDCGGSCSPCPIACQWNDHCGAGDVCYPDICTHSVNDCTIGTATDLRGMTAVTIDFDDGGYTPRCILVTMYTEITFNGSFSEHPLAGGQVKGGEKIPATSGPFMTVTSSGTSKTFAMDACATFPFYCEEHALSGKAGTVFVVSP